MGRNRKTIRRKSLTEIFKYHINKPCKVSEYRLALDIELSFIPKKKRGRGRPRKVKEYPDGIKRPKGRPRKTPFVEVEEVNPVGRPRIYPTAEEIREEKKKEEDAKRKKRLDFRRSGRR